MTVYMNEKEVLKEQMYNQWPYVCDSNKLTFSQLNSVWKQSFSFMSQCELVKVIQRSSTKVIFCLPIHLSIDPSMSY